MNIHEYQAKEIFRDAGLPVPPGDVATTPEEAEELARTYGGHVVVKAQVHTGGRGKAGGVKLADSPEEARKHAGAILGMEIKGLEVRKVLVTPAEEIESEAYVGVLMDRGAQAPVFMVSSEGGVDIEEVARTQPEAIRKLRVDPRYGLLPHQAYWLGAALYDDPSLVKQASKIIGQLYDAYTGSGASMAEINPLITTPGGELKAIDAKVTLDDSELFRHPDLEAYRDTDAEPWAETRAREAGLSFVKLDGDVGCCVNGAGLAMATMDLVKYYGGEPANFLDIGGSSNPDKVVAALEIITADPNVDVILFNIFGGITRCDDVANGIVEATGTLDIDPPIVIRLTGTNEEEGLAILEEAGFSATSSMDAVVQKAVETAGSAVMISSAATTLSGFDDPPMSMAIFVDESTRLVVQGITGRDGSFHAREMMEYGTPVVAGVTPGKGGRAFEGPDGAEVPIFNTMDEAVRETDANASVIYVPPAFAAGAVMEAADAGVDLVVAITEGIPVQDMARVQAFVRDRGTRLVGPNCPGLISPGKAKVGILPAQIVTPGPVGLISRSGTLTYEAVIHLTNAGVGQSTCVGIGGDPLIGTSFVDCLEAFDRDPETEAVVMIGEIGGTDEQEAARYVSENLEVPVVGFIAGQTAPPGRTMGHAGAIISGSEGTAEEKMKAFEENGIAVARRPADIAELIRESL